MNPVEEDRALDGEEHWDAGRRRGREAMDPATRQLALLAGGIGTVLLVLIGGWMLSGRHAGTIPVIEAPPGPVRFKPIDPGGMQALGAQAPSIAEGPPGAGAGGSQTLLPRPEAARPDTLQAEMDAVRPKAVSPPTRSASPPPPTPTPSSESPTSVPPAPAAPSPSPSPSSQAPGLQAPGLQAPALQAPAPRAAPPAHAPVAAPADKLLRTDADPVPARRRTNGPAVQLAAFGSAAAAQSEWSRLCRSHPALFSGRSPEIDQADHEGRTIYRLRTRGFAGSAEATSFCEQARAQHVACTLAAF